MTTYNARRSAAMVIAFALSAGTAGTFAATGVAHAADAQPTKPQLTFNFDATEEPAPCLNEGKWRVQLLPQDSSTWFPNYELQDQGNGKYSVTVDRPNRKFQYVFYKGTTTPEGYLVASTSPTSNEKLRGTNSTPYEGQTTIESSYGHIDVTGAKMFRTATGLTKKIWANQCSVRAKGIEPVGVDVDAKAKGADEELAKAQKAQKLINHTNELAAGAAERAAEIGKGIGEANGPADTTAPVITTRSQTVYTVEEMKPLAIEVKDDRDPNPVVVLKGTLPDGVTYNKATHQIEGTPKAGSEGEYQLTVVATDAAGNEKKQPILLKVIDGEKPQFEVENQTAVVGEEFRYEPTATDNSGEVTVYLGREHPAWLTLVDGVLSGTPTEAGTFTVELTAQDEAGNDVERQLTITVKTVVGKWMDLTKATPIPQPKAPEGDPAPKKDLPEAPETEPAPKTEAPETKIPDAAPSEPEAPKADVPSAPETKAPEAPKSEPAPKPEAPETAIPSDAPSEPELKPWTDLIDPAPKTEPDPQPEVPETKAPEAPKSEPAPQPEAPETKAPQAPKTEPAPQPEAPETKAPEAPKSEPAPQPEAPETKAPEAPKSEAPETKIPDAAPSEPEAPKADVPSAPETKAPDAPKSEPAPQPEAPETKVPDAAPSEPEKPMAPELEFVPMMKLLPSTFTGAVYADSEAIEAAIAAGKATLAGEYTVTRGDKLEVTVKGLEANKDARVFFYTKAMLLAKGTANAAGELAFTLAPTSSTPLGTHYLVATSTVPGVQKSVIYKVTVNPANAPAPKHQAPKHQAPKGNAPQVQAPAPQNQAAPSVKPMAPKPGHNGLPKTGAGVLGTAFAAVAALAAGAGAMIARRREN
ncbi:putative Ig domain-containing protein [Arcanobacterium wilhelmae]|uniref:putative Ig domain-containing protein n=1 Tax=Arcanobacterium wilhelmae TaxID=1803177 RepID=UPI0024153DD7|nr:putative Ig domain-containing protein [Arcanobacterium wilhelmae]WFN90589.1 putative Ig domain-containing protein [Arcanobacterium wilhelmae]